MSKSLIVFHAVSIVAQSKNDRAPVLGRGPGLKHLLQSPKHLSSLKLLQIKGITSTTARFKSDQVLELAENHSVKIIVLQESKLKSDTHLKVKGYVISIGKIDKIRVVEA
ncbi:hypothetical protein TNCV_1093381 [Trichonephila clavipes]|nr:hypothetical protein TNCV_1093381 [Trichonephila clavipes]